MNTRRLVILGTIVAVVSLIAVTTNTYAAPQYYAPVLQNMIPSMMGSNSGNNACNIMNNQGMMSNMMNGQSMNAQQCEQDMASGGSQMMNGQDQQQQCRQQTGTSFNMTAEQCQAMH